MENKKNKKNYLFTFFIISAIVYVSLFISSSSGYYEVKQKERTILTKESMKKFEKDVIEGKNIKIENYLKDTYKDYSNKVSNTGLKTSQTIEYIMVKGIKKSFQTLGKFLG